MSNMTIRFILNENQDSRKEQEVFLSSFWIEIFLQSIPVISIQLLLLKIFCYFSRLLKLTLNILVKNNGNYQILSFFHSGEFLFSI